MYVYVYISYTHNTHLTPIHFFLPPYSGGKKIQFPDGILTISLRIVL